MNDRIRKFPESQFGLVAATLLVICLAIWILESIFVGYIGGFFTVLILYRERWAKRLVAQHQWGGVGHGKIEIAQHIAKSLIDDVLRLLGLLFLGYSIAFYIIIPRSIIFIQSRIEDPLVNPSNQKWLRQYIENAERSANSAPDYCDLYHC
ncbi:MAG: hypothetical protein WC866_00795 [Patescibacteria group bacterium]|jgi:hypothetical protein